MYALLPQLVVVPRHKALGDELYKRSDKLNGELFSLVYGALVVQLIKDFEDYNEVNKQLEKMGYNIGVRLIEDFLARAGLGRCKDFAEVGEVMSKVAFRSLLSITPTLVQHPVSATQPQPAFSLIFEENPMTDFVELPEEAVEGGLSYAKILEGVIRGALEMIQTAVTAEIVSDTLRGDERTELKVTLVRYLEEEMPRSVAFQKEDRIPWISGSRAKPAPTAGAGQVADRSVRVLPRRYLAMGLLALGTPYAWPEAKQHADHVRAHGIVQLLNQYHKLKDRTGDVLLWGDEIEYMVVSYDEDNRNARLSLRQTEILLDLQEDAKRRKKEMPGREECIPIFHPEFGRYMLESTPGAPYGATLEDLLSVEGNMKFRRRLAKSRMKDNEVPLTLTSFPRLGAPGVFTDPYYPPGGDKARSLFVPDEIINPHVRFPTLAANIRARRGSRVAINMPIYFDTNTPKPFVDPNVNLNRGEFPEDDHVKDDAKPDHIYMDAMGFGMGCCCLQITFQACSISEARRMYDALVPVGPIMLALTAAAPIFRGLLSDVDCRWDVIAGSVDDRTREERKLEPLKNSRFVIPKSRYDSVDCYIHDDESNRPEYNDNNMPIDEDIKKKLVDDGMDDKLATHFAHLFIRDPIVVFEETLNQDDAASSDHFENIQSTNWQTVRFKPPAPGSPIGWRVEFRSMEVQLTDYENAAHAIFIVLLVRAIMNLGLNFYLPISKVDENMHRAHRRDAVNQEKFFFRKNLFSPAPGHACDPQPTPVPETNGDSALDGLPSHINGYTGVKATPSTTCSSHSCTRAPTPTGEAGEVNGNGKEKVVFGPVEDEYGEFTINEIINGDGKEFPGLMGVVQKYLDSLELAKETRTQLENSLQLIRRRADGSLLTTASWVRKFVRTHPAYKFDSVVSEEINYDLIKAVDDLESGRLSAPEFLPSCYKGSGDVVKETDGFNKCCGDVMA
ncbi:glutamate-cysteine ligase catalytic subunit [Pseudohyphozyma bogoriensis]|nr:glutamate-cysteine ligase catalytic subunit [Pseudohyphozyma bogoriensis]